MFGWLTSAFHKTPDWVKAIAGDAVVATGILLYEGQARKRGEEKIEEQIAEKLNGSPRQAAIIGILRHLREEDVDRPTFYRELKVINAGPPRGCIQPIVDLFRGIQNTSHEIAVGAHRLQSRKGLVKIDGHWWREVEVIRLMQEIPEEYRVSSYQRLGRLLEQNPVYFIEDLKILDKDEWGKFNKLFVAIGDSEAARAVRQAASALDAAAADAVPTVNAVNNDIRALRTRVWDWAQRG